VGNSPTVNWTIGSKPNTNSSTGSFGAGKRARNAIRLFGKMGEGKH